MFDWLGLSEILSRPRLRPPYAPGMALVLCDITALDFWLGDCPVTRTIAPASLCSWVNGITASGPLPEQQLTRLGISTRPVHVLVPRRSDQRMNASTIAHYAPPPYPEGTITRLTRDVYSLTPIAALIRKSPQLDDVEVLLYLYRILSRYRTYRDCLYERPQLMTLGQMAEYLSRTTRTHGIKRLRLLARYAQEGARSPEEAKAAIILALPPKLGGYGLPLPLLNPPVSAARNGAAEKRYPDLFWPSHNVVLEYQSVEFHDGTVRIGMDAARRTHLQEAGYTVFELTSYQTKRQEELDSLVAALRSHMQLPPKSLTPEQRQANERLRARLFGRPR